MRKKFRITRRLTSVVMALVMTISLLSMVSKTASAAGTYRVTVDYNYFDGGYDLVTRVDIPGGSKYTLPAAPTKGGKIFGGWLCNGTPYKPNQTITVYGNMTFKAIWKVKINVEVEWRANGSTFDHYIDTICPKEDYGQTRWVDFLIKNDYRSDELFHCTFVRFTGWDGYSYVIDKPVDLGQPIRGNGKLFVVMIAVQ